MAMNEMYNVILYETYFNINNKIVDKYSQIF